MQKKYKDSIPYLETAGQLGNYQHDWYNLAVTLAYNGNCEQAEDAFQNVYRTKVQPGFMYAVSMPVILFQYTKALKQKGFTQEARNRANELKRMYTGIGVLNGSNEQKRGLPTYHNFRREISALFTPDELTEWEKKHLKF